MVTRLYPNDAVIEPISVTPSGWASGWGLTVSETVGTLSGALSTGTASLSNANNNGVVGNKSASQRYISKPLGAQNISGTIKGQFLCSGTVSDHNTLAVALRILDSSGNERAVLLQPTASDDIINTPPGLAASGTNRSLNDANESASITLTPANAQDGDVLCLEIGFRMGSSSIANGNNSLAIYSDNTSFPGAEATDLPEDNTTTNNALNPWVEFSQDLNFKSPFLLKGSTVIPFDSSSATNATTTITLTPPAGIKTGDLVVVVCESKASTTWTNSTTGGQTWTAEAGFGGPSSVPSSRIFWCVFNGTWSANPVFTSTSGTGTTANMIVFRAATVKDTWAIDVAQSTSTFTAPSSPFTVTITGVTTVANNVVALGVIASNDDNTYGSLSGTGWKNLPLSQCRNVASTDMSMTAMHQVRATPGATNNVSKNQATLGGDEGGKAIIAWKDVSPPIPELNMAPYHQSNW